MAVKTFEENHEPLELKLRDRDGKSHVVYTLLLTSGDIKEMELIGLKKNKKKFETETDALFAMMLMACGKNKEFWSKFSLLLLSDVLDFLTEEVKKKL